MWSPCSPRGLPSPPPPHRLSALGARDSLRLEAGLCLYGHDMDGTVTPAEATLVWTIGKRRRAEGGGFIGSDVILRQVRQRRTMGGQSAGEMCLRLVRQTIVADEPPEVTQ